jgi:alanyl-tRNA synthetase
MDQAMASGAMALFGEKYGDRVRVVQMGEEAADSRFSVELCGGTHVRRTGDIGMFRITSESSVAAGVRRIEAVTGSKALSWTRARDEQVMLVADRLKAKPDTLEASVTRLIEERKRLEKELSTLQRTLAQQHSADLATQARLVGGIQVLAAELSVDAATLRDEADRLRDSLGSSVVVLGSRMDDSVKLVATVSKDLAGTQVHAGKLIKQVAKLVGGGGGGRPDMAQAGGRHPDALPDALEAVYGLVAPS